MEKLYPFEARPLKFMNIQRDSDLSYQRLALSRSIPVRRDPVIGEFAIRRDIVSRVIREIRGDRPREREK